MHLSLLIHETSCFSGLTFVILFRYSIQKFRLPLGFFTWKKRKTSNRNPKVASGHTFAINSNKFIFQIQYVLHHSNDFARQPKSQPSVCVCEYQERCNFNVNFHIISIKIKNRWIWLYLEFRFCHRRSVVIWEYVFQCIFFGKYETMIRVALKILFWCNVYGTVFDKIWNHSKEIIGPKT